MGVTFSAGDFRSPLYKEGPDFSNTNARSILRILEMPVVDGEIYGVIEDADEIGAILLRCKFALSETSKGLMARSGALRETVSEPNFWVGGSQDEDVKRRLRSMESLLEYAVNKGLPLFWS